jgi:hypothetical protein
MMVALVGIKCWQAVHIYDSLGDVQHYRISDTYSIQMELVHQTRWQAALLDDGLGVVQFNRNSGIWNKQIPMV